MREPTLTPREGKVMELFSLGHDRQEVADRLGITLSSVDNHVASVYRKFRVNNRVQAVTELTRRGLLPRLARP